LAEALCKRAKAVILTGETAEKIKSAILNCPNYREGLFELVERKNFTEAVISASNTASEKDIVILSPACASFDAFRNFEERGKKFKEIIKGLE